MHRNIWTALGLSLLIFLLFCTKGDKELRIDYDSDFEFSDNLWEPCDMTVDREGNLYLLDRYEGACVHKFDASGVYLGKIGSLGKERGELFLPLSVAVDDVGGVWIADRVNKRLTRYSSEGECLMVMGPEEGFEMQSPEAMVIGDDGMIYIADSLADVIWRVEPIGTVERYEPEQDLHGPEDLLWLEEGLLVVDTGKERIIMPNGSIIEVTNKEGERMIPHKIKKYEQGYALIASLGEKGGGGGKFQPYLLIVDGEFKTLAEHKLDPELVGDVAVISKEELLVSYPKLHRVVRYRVEE